jgi:hypothetical protein
MHQLSVAIRSLDVPWTDPFTPYQPEGCNYALEMVRPWYMKPTDPFGIRAQHLPEWFIHYGDRMAAARQEVAMALKAGINTFALLLGPDHLPNSRYAPVIHATYQAALETGDFKIYPDIWRDLDKEDEINRLANAMGELAQKYDSVWRRYKGKRVVFLYSDAVQRGDPSVPYGPTVEKIFAKIGGRESVWLVVYKWPSSGVKGYALSKMNDEWRRGADAYFLWPASFSYGDDKVLGPALAKEAAAMGKEYWFGVCPSFLQARPSLKHVSIKERLGMVAFLYGWMEALAHKAPAVEVVTWNDLTEDSSIMPESNHGYVYWELNRYMAAWYQSGQAPAIEQEKILLFHHPQVVQNVQLPPGQEAPTTYNWLATPPTDYVGIVGLLKEPARVVVHVGPKVTAVQDLPAGMKAWLIYNPITDMSTIRDRDVTRSCAKAQAVYPEPTDWLAVSKVDQAFEDSEVYIEVYRNNRRVALFRSTCPIRGFDRRGDLTTHGDVFELRASGTTGR